MNSMGNGLIFYYNLIAWTMRKLNFRARKTITETRSTQASNLDFGGTI